MATPQPHAETDRLIEAVEQADSAAGLLAAAAALASHLAGCQEPPLQAVQALVQVLGFNNPGAAVAAVDGLIACGGAAVDPLLSNLDAHNYGARAWAVRALAGIGDVRGLELLEQALASDIGPSVRRAAARGLGQLQWQCLDQGERLEVQGRSLVALEAGSEDGEWVVRYAVVVGLEGLGISVAPAVSAGGVTAEASLFSRVRQTLEQRLAGEAETIPVVRLRAAQALERLRAAAA